jgi:hypothetical protein
MICECKISKVNTEKGTADILIPDRDDCTLGDIPFVNIEPDKYPQVGDWVVAIFEGTGGRYGKGFILGKTK